jgi:hypothetical protein
VAQALANKEDNKGTKMNVNLKEKLAQIYARKGTREAPARWSIPLFASASV